MAFVNYKTVKYKKGDIIIKEGDRSDDIFLINSGNAECYTVDELGRKHVKAEFSGGDIFGELDMVLGRTRRYSVKATSDLEVVIVDPRIFSELFENENYKYITPIIQAYAKHIREYENKLASVMAESKSKVNEEMTVAYDSNSDYKVYIVSNSRRAFIAMQGKESIRITRFPYRVGRLSRRRSDMLFHKNELYLHDRHPFNISRSHFAIIKKSNGYYFQDYGSWHGSEVNGEKLINPGKKNDCLLKIGENIVKLGSKDSDLIFKIIIKKS